MDRQREQYIAMLQRRREGVRQMCKGIENYFGTQLDLEIMAIENEPEFDSGVEAKRLTAELAHATVTAQTAEQYASLLNHLLADPSMEFLKQYQPIIEAVLMPMINEKWSRAVSQRDAIQQELMELERPE